jgi:transposase
VSRLLADWLETHRRLDDTEQRMTTILDQLRLAELVTSITGLSAIGAAAIVAETGDLHRFAPARTLVKHAGPAPREKPRLNLPAAVSANWRLAVGAVPSGPLT